MLQDELHAEPGVHRFVEELKMLTQTDIERERYEARRKAQLDYNSGMNFARTQGEMIGAIHAYEHMLEQVETPTDQLLALSRENLARLAEELKTKASSRR
jgi:hypothetical protein